MTKKTDKKADDIQAQIAIKQLILDSRLQWKLKLIVGQILSTIYQFYTVRMVFNEEPYLEQIEELKAENSLLPAETAREINRIKEAMKEEKEKCPKIEFVASLAQLKYGQKKTEILINIQDSVIDSLNQHKQLLKANYIAKLIPLEVSNENK